MRNSVSSNSFSLHNNFAAAARGPEKFYALRLQRECFEAKSRVFRAARPASFASKIGCMAENANRTYNF